MGRAPAIGDLVAERYRIESLLGRGGMGSVYVAQHVLSERRVALKCLDADLELEPEARDRFLREARAMGRIEHPNVVSVLDVGTEGPLAFFAMELLRGQTLRARMERERDLDVASALALLVPAIEGVHAAHSVGVVHRDLKPENLFVVEHGTTKVLDFGISKLEDTTRSDPSTLSRNGSLFGTPAYMAPEQIQGGPVDARTDVWGLCTILYELFSGGSKPFAASSMGQLVIAIAKLPYTPLDPRRVPADVARVVHRGLAKSPADRWTSAEELARALAPFMGPARSVELRSARPEPASGTRDAAETLSLVPPRASTPRPTSAPPDAATIARPTRSALRGAELGAEVIVAELAAPAPDAPLYVLHADAHDALAALARACVHLDTPMLSIAIDDATDVDEAIAPITEDDAVVLLTSASLSREKTVALVVALAERRARLVHVPRADARLLATSVRAPQAMIEAIQRRAAALSRMDVCFSLDESRARRAPPLGAASTRWRVESPAGTSLEVTLDHHYPLIGSGRPPLAGDYEVVPMGYLHTYPSRVSGTYVADRLAYGAPFRASAADVRRAPIRVDIEDGVVVRVHTSDAALGRALDAHLACDPYAMRVGNVGLGTNPLALAELGHDAHDGVMPGLVLCLGDTQQPITGAPFRSHALLRLGGRAQTVWADEHLLVERGRLVSDLAEATAEVEGDRPPAREREA
jgi:serine/threonine-protein kinase